MCLFIKQQVLIFIMVVVIQSNTTNISLELRILIYDSGTSNEKIYKRDIQL